MRHLCGIACAVVLVVAPRIASEQGQSRIEIYVESTTDDPVGGRLAFAIREDLARSATLALASSPSVYVIHLVTIPANANDPSDGTVGAVVLTRNLGHGDVFVTCWVLQAGLNRVEQEAASIIAQVGNSVLN